MRRLSDIKEFDEIIVLWSEILPPFQKIIVDNEVSAFFRGGVPLMEMVSVILKKYPKEAEKIVLAVDKTPITVFNFPVRIWAIISDLISVDDFFGSAEQAQTASEFSGSVMENTEANAK